MICHAKAFGLNAEGSGGLFRVIVVFWFVNFEDYLGYSVEKDYRRIRLEEVKPVKKLF